MKNVSLPIRLRSLRARSGWTLEEAATHVGITTDNLGRLERGASRPRVGTLRKLSDAYGVDVEELMTLEDAAGGKASAPPQGPEVVFEESYTAETRDEVWAAAMEAAKEARAVYEGSIGTKDDGRNIVVFAEPDSALNMPRLSMPAQPRRMGMTIRGRKRGRKRV
jgi:transcriptional regulator with XRE-family HTH domain